MTPAEVVAQAATVLVCRSQRTTPYTPPGHREDGGCCEGPYEPPHGRTAAEEPDQQ